MTRPDGPAGLAVDGYRGQCLRQTAADGTLLFQRRYRPRGCRPTGRLDLIHGWADHSGRYDLVLEALRPLNLEVCLPDLRGHGRSGGRRGHIRRFEDYLTDLADLLELSAPAPRCAPPRWLLGHSMGGLVAFYLALRHPRHYQGVILASPFLAPLPPLGAAKRLLAATLSWVAPTLPLHRQVDPLGISHDPDIARAYREDPLVHGRWTPCWLQAILSAQAGVPEAAPALHQPLLLQLSPDDPVVDPQAALAAYLRLPAGAKALRVYPHRAHELYNETPDRRSKPLGDLVAWIGARQEAWLLASV